MVDAVPTDAHAADGAIVRSDAAPSLDAVPPFGDAASPPPGDAASPPPADAASPPPGDATSPPPGDAAAPPRDAAPPPRPDAQSVADRQYGAACESGMYCDSNLCIDGGNTELGRCTQTCILDADCPGFDVCRPVGALGSFICRPFQTGRPCAVDADCGDEICHTPLAGVPGVTPQSICMDRCSAKCPTGYACRPVAIAQGVEARACDVLPEVVGCSTDLPETCGANRAACPAQDANQADHVYCVGGPDGFNHDGYCSCNCSIGRDCPPGFGCVVTDEHPSGNADRPGICLAFAGYRCPAQPSAAATAQCPSQACVAHDGAARDAFCSISCVNDRACPPDYYCDFNLNACAPRPVR